MKGWRGLPGLVGLGGDLPDQLLRVGDLLFVRLELLGDLGLVLLRQVHAGGEGLGFLDGAGHAALGFEQGLLGTGELALVQDEVPGSLGDPGVDELEGVLDPGRFLTEGGLLVFEGIGECHRRRGAHARRQDECQCGADDAGAAAAHSEPGGTRPGAVRCIGVMGFPFSLRTLDPQVSTKGQE